MWMLRDELKGKEGMSGEESQIFVRMEDSCQL